MKIPLITNTGRPYAPGVAAGQALSVGFEMGALDREKMRVRMGPGGGQRGGLMVVF